MRMRWLAIAVVMAGCGEADDPIAGRLKPGQEVIAVSVDDRDTTVAIDDRSWRGYHYVTLEPGTRLLVDSDKAASNMTRAIDTDSQGRPVQHGDPVEHRPVSITVMSGDHRGIAGTINRFRVRPAAPK